MGVSSVGRSWFRIASAVAFGLSLHGADVAAQSSKRVAREGLTSTEGWDVANGAELLEEDAPGVFCAKDAKGNAAWYWEAPSGYVGDQEWAFGRDLVFSLRVDDTRTHRVDPDTDAPDVQLVGGGWDIAIDLSPDPTTEWREYRVSLSADADWFDTDAREYVDDDVIREVLSDLEYLWIRGEFSRQRDTGWIRGVTLGAPSRSDKRRGSDDEGREEDPADEQEHDDETDDLEIDDEVAEAFAQDLASVRRAMDSEDWSDAHRRLARLFDDYADTAVARNHARILAEYHRQILFHDRYEPPTLDDVFGGDVKSVRERRGVYTVEVEYTKKPSSPRLDGLPFDARCLPQIVYGRVDRDCAFDAGGFHHTSGGLHIHRARFTEVRVIVTGEPALPNKKAFPRFVVGVDEELWYEASVTWPSGNEVGFWTQGRLIELDIDQGDCGAVSRDELDKCVRVGGKYGLWTKKHCKIKLDVSGSKIKASLNDVISASGRNLKDKDASCRVGFIGVPNIESVVIDGDICPDWWSEVLEDAEDVAREEFEMEYDAEEELPDWLYDAL